MKSRFLALVLCFTLLCVNIPVSAAEDTTAASTEAVTETSEPASSEASEEKTTASETDASGADSSVQAVQEPSDKGASLITPSSDSLDLAGDGILLMDAETGGIIYARNEKEKFYPASITKILTTLVALENCDLSEKVTFKRETLDAIEQDSSRVGLLADETMTLEDALYCVMLVSGNDAAAGVAEHVGGTIDNFVKMMNEKVKELGCVNSHFQNPHGLHNENHYTCAYDMGLIMQAAVNNPDFCKIASAKMHKTKKTNKYRGRELWNHHKMLLPASEYAYDGVCEGKTGYTTTALNTLVTTAEKNGMKLIAVTLHCPGAAYTYSNTKALFDYGFKTASLIHPLKDITFDQLLRGISENEKAGLESLNPVFNHDYSILVPKDVKPEDIHMSVVKDGTKKGTWGSIHFSYKDKEIGLAHIYYDKHISAAEAALGEDLSDNGTFSKMPYILTFFVVFLILFIVLRFISIYRRRNIK